MVFVADMVWLSVVLVLLVVASVAGWRRPRLWLSVLAAYVLLEAWAHVYMEQAAAWVMLQAAQRGWVLAVVVIGFGAAVVVMAEVLMEHERRRGQ